ncbi:DUF2267 domain-containing protein [Halalkalicoccus sp. NIPERK01]|uniref:DUF2267 domain-containing protein n=1 Tax=Halalkalicoccus sp. NIPERK01 TaxID=3053469 RepID=UPI00256F4641|nr:DUF2267 domain-containing protein [Halalkalicoccus sp. NIPERK01]MDL5361008.1 DUF2267 domain-containing protein [Halalkalicoccus sp. NIPERK01]
MEPSEFYTIVRQQANLESAEEAEAAADAVLETFAERLSPGESEEIAERLPDEPAGAIGTDDEGEDFGPEEFRTRVERRAGIDEDLATRATRATVHALEEAAGEAFTDVREQFPAEYDDLFGGASGS